MSKTEWEANLDHACRKWPGSANYLQELACTWEMWGSPCRLAHFTLDMEDSSVAEGYLFDFHKGLDGLPHSFAGVVQQHVNKDEEKHYEERMFLVKDKILPYDKCFCS